MLKELHTKTLVVVGCTPVIKDYIEELTEAMPSVFRHSLKKATKDFIRELDKLQNSIFSDENSEEKKERAEQLNNISIGFESWVKENF